MPLISAGYELSLQQKQLFIQGKESAAAGMSILLEGGVDKHKIRQALEALGQRHEVLRTSFQRRPGMKFPFQVVHEKPAFVWAEADLSGLGADEQAYRLAELFRNPPQVETEKAPFFHATFAKLGAGRHSLALAFSRLCVDDASLSRLFAELCALYAGQPLPEDILQYADYSEWQSECLSSDDADAKRASDFWQKTEFESLPTLSLPLERKRAAGESSWESIPLRLNLTPAPHARGFLLTAWQVFLERISGRQDFVLGDVSDGRNHEEFSHGIGPFERILPLRMNCERDQSFSEREQRANEVLAAALDHQDYFAAERVGDHVPVGFAFCESTKATQTGNVTVSELMRHVPPAGLHLQLRFSTNGSSLEASLAYDAAYFPREIATQLAERFVVLANAAQANPAALTSTFPIMSEGERRKVLLEFNQTAADYPRDACIHNLFEKQAALHPDHLALRFGERALTYAELNREANRIAHLLMRNGVGANVPVALCVERSAEMIIALLGILKAGGCYVPLVPDNPQARLAHELNETRAPVILTEQKHLPNLPLFSGKIICLDRDSQLLKGESDSNPEVKNSSQDLVYVIYTSGSTGTPKGVAVRHFNLVNYSHFIFRRLELEKHPEGLHFATVSTMSADLGNTCIFPALISGGCLHVIGYETAMSPAVFSEYASRYPFDVLKITPSHLSSLLDGEHDRALLPRKYLIVGGEAARWDLVERVRQAAKCALLNHYGPTEATVGCCTFSPDSNEVSAWEPATMPIGKPIANDEIYILGRHMQPVPIGVAGELCIGGVGLAQGYLNQPQQTAERFVSHPFSADPEARLYRTGDLARFLPDGNIEFLGRIDTQVKIRGFRVEPAEVESVLKRHPALQQVAIVSYDDPSGEKRLAAYLVTRAKVQTEDLRSFLLQHLPEYMVPSAFVALEALPLTANGKLDLRALPVPEQQASVHDGIAPRSAEEEKLALIWQEVLRLDRVGVTDNFFELGGHSLLATQIISRVRNTFRIQMPLQVFLQHPTIAAMAEQIGQCPAIESEQEEMARLLRELEGISEEEAQRLLAAELQKENDGGGR